MCCKNSSAVLFSWIKNLSFGSNLFVGGADDKCDGCSSKIDGYASFVRTGELHSITNSLQSGLVTLCVYRMNLSFKCLQTVF